MPKIRYLGPEDEVTCRGGTWSRTKWTDSTTTNADDDDIAVLMGNPYFSVEDDVPADDPAPIEPPSPEVGRVETAPESREAHARGQAPPSGVEESAETLDAPAAA